MFPSQRCIKCLAPGSAGAAGERLVPGPHRPGCGRRPHRTHREDHLASKPPHALCSPSTYLPSYKVSRWAALPSGCGSESDSGGNPGLRAQPTTETRGPRERGPHENRREMPRAGKGRKGHLNVWMRMSTHTGLSTPAGEEHRWKYLGPWPCPPGHELGNSRDCLSLMWPRHLAGWRACPKCQKVCIQHVYE